MQKVVVLNKKEGETPLAALEKFKKKNLEYAKVPMTYAGRLDPLASGVLVVLAGEKIKDKEKYLALDKSYNFSVLFGFGTDTCDILGKVLAVDFDAEKKYKSMQDFSLEIKKNLKYFEGKIKQKYPIYSSKTVNGKPLFSYARSGESVKIPTKQVFIKKIVLEEVGKVNSKKLFYNIEKRIKKVEGDFRQKEILNIWRKKLLGKKEGSIFNVANFNIECGSGTYVRQIANSLGEKMKIPALALSIKRTKVGRFKTTF